MRLDHTLQEGRNDLDTLLIAPYVNYAKYYPEDRELPYEGTGRKLRDELLKRTTKLNVILAQSEEEFEKSLPETESLVSPKLTRHILARASRLRWVQATSAGIDHFFRRSDVTLADVKARGIALTTAAGAAHVVISEQVLAYMLMFSRQMHRCLYQQMDKVWDIFTADELLGRTVGIIGLGTIGSRVAQLCKCFGMIVIGTKRDPQHYEGPADEVLPASAYRDVFRRADYLILACSLSPDTRGMVNADTLALMKPTAYLINIGRGQLVEEQDLVHALKSGQIAGAGIDTFGPQLPQRTAKDFERLSPDSPLWGMRNVIITPNHASGTPRIYEYLAQIIVDNWQRVQEGLPLRNLVR